MRNKFILSGVLLFLATGLLWAQFWKDYSEKDRQRAGEAYWLAGRQYQEVGKTEKGRDHMALGRLIYPQLDPDTIADEQLPSAAELLARGKATTIGAGSSAVPTGAIDSFFLRFVGTMLDEDAAAAVDFLDGSVYLTQLTTEVTRADAQEALDGFFKEAPLRGMGPSAVYDLDSVVVARAPQAMQKAWGETYTLTVNARKDYSEAVSFWDMQQQFFIRRAGGEWRIFSFGQNPPPLTWSPNTAVAVAAAAPAGARQADTNKAITEAFSGFITALLTKDAEGAVQYASADIRFLRLRQTVTRDELKTSLQGYFDNADFGGAAPADVLDLDSVFVEQAASPVEGVEDPVYMLNAKARVDLSGSLPIWSTYQSYYYTKDGNDWKIFAILM